MITINYLTDIFKIKNKPFTPEMESHVKMVALSILNGVFVSIALGKKPLPIATLFAVSGLIVSKIYEILKNHQIFKSSLASQDPKIVPKDEIVLPVNKIEIISLTTNSDLKLREKWITEWITNEKSSVQKKFFKNLGNRLENDTCIYVKENEAEPLKFAIDRTLNVLYLPKKLRSETKETFIQNLNHHLSLSLNRA